MYMLRSGLCTLASGTVMRLGVRGGTSRVELATRLLVSVGAGILKLCGGRSVLYTLATRGRVLLCGISSGDDRRVGKASLNVIGTSGVRGVRVCGSGI